MFDFSGQKVIVTGAVRGIGKSVAEAFLKAGAHVIATYSTSGEAAEKFRADNARYEGKFELHKFDVSDYAAVEEFFREIEKTHGAIDVLVNNAGIRKDSVLAMMKKEDWASVIGVNMTGVFNMCKFAVMMMMKKRYGRIVNVTSAGAEHCFEGQANYASSKAGVVSMTKVLSKETAKRGITVNCVSPGFITTDLIKDLPEKTVQEYTAMIPMKRFGKPEEVSHCILFVASREASYITGAQFDVTGGI